MKCQNCGKSEVNFHYSSNLNGCVTETYLCSECAAKSGYNMHDLFDVENMFQGFFPILNGQNAFTPMSAPLMGFSMPYRLAALPMVDQCSIYGDCGCDCGKVASDDRIAEVDEEMKDRRELYRQMRIAAENEDFEKAAELRDKLKEME